VPAEPPKTARGKDIIRSLNEIIRLENERGAISAMQQQGRQNAGTEASDSAARSFPARGLTTDSGSRSPQSQNSSKASKNSYLRAGSRNANPP
jgi:hypothetical protein